MENWSFLEPGDPFELFDGRICEINSAPQRNARLGWWADVREVVNARDPNFAYAEYGPVERVSLAGGKDPIALSRQYVEDLSNYGPSEARARLRARKKAMAERARNPVHMVS